MKSKEYIENLSIYNAFVKVGYKNDNIYNHIINSLRRTVGDKVRHTTVLKEAEFFIVNGVQFEMDSLKYFTKLIWIKYLVTNNDLVKFISELDDFEELPVEPFDFIKKNILKSFKDDTVKDVLKSCNKFIYGMEQGGLDVYINKSILEFLSGYIIHPVSCDGYTGNILTQLIINDYPTLFENYEMKCKQAGYSRMNMGLYSSEIISFNKHLVNIFCYDSQKSNTFELKSFKNALQRFMDDVGNEIVLVVPHKLGLDLSIQEWDEVSTFIDVNFKNVKYL